MQMQSIKEFMSICEMIYFQQSCRLQSVLLYYTPPAYLRCTQIPAFVFRLQTHHVLCTLRSFTPFVPSRFYVSYLGALSKCLKHLIYLSCTPSLSILKSVQDGSRVHQKFSIFKDHYFFTGQKKNDGNFRTYLKCNINSVFCF